MRLIFYPAWIIVTLLIVLLAALGISIEWGAGRLTTTQKFLTKKLEGK